MPSMKLNWSMLLRRRFGNSLTILLVAATAVFLLLYPRLITAAEAGLAHAYTAAEVTGWLYNAGGYEDPLIKPAIYEYILETRPIKEHYAYSYIKFGKADQALWELRKADRTLLSKSRDELMPILRDRLGGMAFIGYLSTLYGVNCADAETSFSRIQDEIRWLEGYSATDLAGEERIAIFPTLSGYRLDQEAELVLQKKNYQETGSEIRGIVSFKVVGLYDLKLGESTDSSLNTINMKAYCPLGAMRDLLNHPKWEFCVRSFSFTLHANRELLRFKDRLNALGLNKDQAVRAAIDDRILREAVAPIEKNLDLLRGLHAFFYALVALMSFFLCFLLTRRRKPEYAVMRMLGESRLQVTGQALWEQLVLCALGIGTGLLLLLLFGQGDHLAWGAIGLIIGCYFLGAAGAVLLTVRVDVMTILREKE